MITLKDISSGFCGWIRRTTMTINMNTHDTDSSSRAHHSWAVISSARNTATELKATTAIPEKIHLHTTFLYIFLLHKIQNTTAKHSFITPFIPFASCWNIFLNITPSLNLLSRAHSVKSLPHTTRNNTIYIIICIN